MTPIKRDSLIIYGEHNLCKAPKLPFQATLPAGAQLFSRPLVSSLFPQEPFKRILVLSKQVHN